MFHHLPSPPMSPRPSPPSGEPLPKEGDESGKERPRTLHTPDIRIRPPYRTFPANWHSAENIPSNVAEKFSLALIRHTIEMEQMYDEVITLEIQLDISSAQETFTEDDCVRQFNLDTEIKCLKKRYHLMEIIEEMDFPILPRKTTD